MGKTSRTKGARGELEVVHLAVASGLEAQRTAALQAGRVPGHPDVALMHHPGYHIEVKRDERLSVDAMLRQAEGDAPPGRVPLLAYRRNGQPWRGVLPLATVFELIGSA
jgi:Holliday junction resolvase